MLRQLKTSACAALFICAITWVICAITWAGGVRAADTYHLKRELSVPSEGSAFDYVTFHAHQLYVGHRAEGLQVFDSAADMHMTPVADTKGSNGAMMMPDLDLGVSHNTDGTLTLFGLSDLTTKRRIKVGEEVDSSRYDPVTHRLAVFGVPASSGGKGIELVVLQAPGMEKVAAVPSKSSKLEHSVSDGTGSIFVAAQDQNAIVRFDMRALQFTASWPVPCKQPTGLDYDAAHKRLMIGCRGDYTEPMFVVMNADDGGIVFTAPLSPGNDGVAYDALRGRVLATNGIGATLVVFAQQDADHYALSEVVMTRPMAKTLALDPASGDVFTIAAEGVYDAARKNLAYIAPFYPNSFTRDSFRVLQYGR